jgi:hypothetical protein
VRWNEVQPSGRELLTGVADALAVAHDAKILHRNIWSGWRKVTTTGHLQ